MTLILFGISIDIIRPQSVKAFLDMLVTPSSITTSFIRVPSPYQLHVTSVREPLVNWRVETMGPSPVICKVPSELRNHSTVSPHNPIAWIEISRSLLLQCMIVSLFTQLSGAHVAVWLHCALVPSNNTSALGAILKKQA